MKKTTSRNEQFRGRVGKHALTGFARGFCETLPRRAIIEELERRSIKEMIDTLNCERHRLEKEMKICTENERFKELRDSLCRCTGRIGMMKKELPNVRGRTFAETFTMVCDLMLKQESLHHCKEIAHCLIRHLQMKETDKLSELVSDFEI